MKCAVKIRSVFTSHPRGNKVDGLPRASTLARNVVEACRMHRECAEVLEMSLEVIMGCVISKRKLHFPIFLHVI